MEEIVIKTSIEKDKLNAIIDQIYNVCRTDPYLSPCSKKELLKAYEKKNLFLAFYKDVVVGWLLKVPFNKSCQELAAGYVIESYRPKGVFNKLLTNALPLSRSSIIVTFNYPFAKYLLWKTGFRNSSLIEAIKLSRGKFIFNRVKIERIKAIYKHYQQNKPIYTIYNQ